MERTLPIFVVQPSLVDPEKLIRVGAGVSNFVSETERVTH